MSVNVPDNRPIEQLHSPKHLYSPMEQLRVFPPVFSPGTRPTTNRLLSANSLGTPPGMAGWLTPG
ncbi:hypothetical protein H4Q26_000531 [Puccinia striiformis f. sp. tritici PST-130]|nr:hypothetical protein H4Q26_000531 [Puccinia striiformis f. sp. tritici PST-130]